MQHLSQGRITQHAPADPLGVPDIAWRIHAGTVGADAFGSGGKDASVAEAAAVGSESVSVIDAEGGIGQVSGAAVGAPAQAVGDLKAGQVFYGAGRVAPAINTGLFVDGLRLALQIGRAHV